MNNITRDKLKEFTQKVALLAMGTIHMIGTDTCQEICKTCDELSQQLDQDPTIYD